MTISRVDQISHFENPESEFVGRKRELSTLSAALRQARSGFSSIFLLSGEAGIGKTLLVREFSAFAQSGGAKVLEGRASVRFRDLPFGVWRQILSDPMTRQDSSSADLPHIEAASLPRAPIPFHRSVGHQIDADLFDTTARALAEQARAQPLVLVLDDLHVADPLSLQAFRVLARELSRFGTLMIGVYRDSEIRRFQEFGELLLDPVIRDSKRISLAPFDDQETREFVQSRVTSPLEEQRLTALRTLTGGNPRLLEIALRRHLLDEAPPGSEKMVGAMLRAEIEAHLEHLSAQAREVLNTASLAGNEVGISWLFHILEQDPRELLDSLYEAEQSGLLVATESPGAYRFRQALVQEILAAELSGAQRARLHAKFGEVLELLHPRDDAFVERIAHHFYEAALLGYAAKAADYCSRAAAHAFSESRAVDGTRFYHMALVALELRGSAPDEIQHLKAKLDEIESDPSEAILAARSLPQNEEQTTSLKPSNLETFAPLGVTTPSKSRIAAELTSRAGNPKPTLGRDSVDSTLLTESSENAFRREGDYWTLLFEGRILRLRHSNGLLLVAHLLEHPDCDFHASQLVALLPSARANHLEVAYISGSDKERLGMHTVSSHDSNPLLDTVAKADYRRRIDELRDAIECANRFSDLAKVGELEQELEFIRDELSRAVGISGRDRQHRMEEERARVNVTNAIRMLTAKIAKQHPSFGRYLRLTVRTGRFCSYRPDPRMAPHWQF